MRCNREHSRRVDVSTVARVAGVGACIFPGVGAGVPGTVRCAEQPLPG